MNDTPEAQTYIHAQRSVDINGLLCFACCVSSVDVIFSNFSFSLVSLRRECIRFQFLPLPLRRPNYSTRASVCDWVGERVCQVRVLFFLSANEPKRKEIAEVQLS